MNQPGRGDQYIATDTGYIYILKEVPFTSGSNWVLLTQSGVTSVNGLQGIVSLSSDDITEGVVNKYFDSGISSYKSTLANQANELVKLNGSGVLPG